MKPGHDISFISALCLNLMLAGSLLMTPLVVHSLANSGLAHLSTNLSHLGIGPTAITPLKLLGIGKEVTARTYNATHTAANRITGKYFPNAHETTSQVWRMHTTPLLPKIWEKPRTNGSKEERTQATTNVHVNVQANQKAGVTQTNNSHLQEKK
jgi:hypothetical protein